jgi:DNA-binding LacI/PurR family transcriptional regulator
MDVIAAAHKYQLRVPRDLSVVVFDDISASGLVASHLTTVNQSMKEKGRLAVSSLLRMRRFGTSYPQNLLFASQRPGVWKTLSP